MIDTLRSDLETGIDPEYKARVRDHCNMDVSSFLGVRTPAIRKIASAHFRDVKDKTIGELLALCEQLLETGIYECKIIAFDWSYRYRRQLGSEHFVVLQHWLQKYVDDWTDCDDFCTHTLGAFLLQHPNFLSQVEAWTSSQNRWVRRASAVSLIYGLRRGKHLKAAFVVAQALCGDEDSLVQKGCGWMLKEASKKRPQEVFDYVMQWREAMPRTMLRYAVERLEAGQRQAALKRAI